MAATRKQVISVRLDATDIRRTKAIARRLQTSESEIMRFALRQLFKRLGPLHSTATHGQHLLPLFLDLGSELTEHFNMDATRISQVLNDGTESAEDRVSAKDVALLSTLAQMGALGPENSELSGDGRCGLDRLHDQAREHALLTPRRAPAESDVVSEQDESVGVLVDG